MFLIRTTTQGGRETRVASPTHRIIPRALHVVVGWDLLPPQEEEGEEEEEEIEKEEEEEEKEKSEEEEGKKEKRD